MEQNKAQRYFRDKCRAFCTACEEAKKLNLLPIKSERERLEFRNWSHRTNRDFDDIVTILREMKEENQQVIVTEKSQVVVLIGFFCRNSPKEWKIIYTDEKYLKDFPSDKLSEEFLQAYFKEDQKRMTDLLKDAF